MKPVVCRFLGLIAGCNTLRPCAAAPNVPAALFFHMPLFGESDPTNVFQQVFVLMMIPLPLAIGGVALLAARRNAGELWRTPK